MAKDRAALLQQYERARGELDAQINRAMSSNVGQFVPFAFDAAIAAAMDLMLSGIEEFTKAVASYVATAEQDRKDAGLERASAKADRESQERNRESMRKATWVTGIFTVVIALATAVLIFHPASPVVVPAPVVNVATPPTPSVVVPAPVVNVTIPRTTPKSVHRGE